MLQSFLIISETLKKRNSTNIIQQSKSVLSSLQQARFLHHWGPQRSFGLVSTLTLTHDLHRVIAFSICGIEYLCKIWLKSFSPFRSYCVNKFLHATLVWFDLCTLWSSWREYVIITLYSTTCTYSSFSVILQAIQEIWGPNFFMWPCSDLDLGQSTFKTGRAPAAQTLRNCRSVIVRDISLDEENHY